MPTAHWPRTTNPFAAHGPDHAWFPGGDHDEALSRMLYLVERGHGCGVVEGAAGSGKSRLLRELARRSRKPSTTTIALNLTGLDRAGFAVQCAQGCAIGFDAATSTMRVWTCLEDWLRGRAAVGGRVLWLLDDFDQAAEALAAEILRLMRLAEHTSARSVFIITRQPDADDAALANDVDFRTGLTPWDDATSRAFVEQILISAGGSGEIITESAWNELLSAAQGSPQRLLRLMEVALHAGGVLGSAHVTRELMTAVADQLGWTARHSAVMLPVD